MFGLFVIFCLVAFPSVAMYYYNKGIKKSGHICKTAKVLPGERYKPAELKFVQIQCLDCGENIRSEAIVVRTFKGRDKGQPYRVDLKFEDYQVHQLLNHPKAGTITSNE
jgi:hypothetical protein